MAPDSRKVWIIVGGAVLAAMVIWLGFAALSGWLVDFGDRVPQSVEASVMPD